MRKVSCSLFVWIGALVVLVLLLIGAAKPPVPLHRLGTTIPLPAEAHRIASFGAGINEMVLTLSNPTRSVSIGRVPLNTPELAKSVPHKIPLSVEAVLSVSPDLIIVPGWVSQAVIAQLEQLNIPVVVLPAPTDFSSIEENITRLGQVLGNEKGAAALNREIETELQEAAARQAPYIAKHGRLKAVYVTASGAIGGVGSTVNDILVKSGLRNGVAEAGIGSIGTLPKASVVAFNPDVIIVSNDIYETGKPTASMKTRILADPAYAQTTAVKEGRIYVVDGRWLASTNQFAAKAVVSLTEQIYPK